MTNDLRAALREEAIKAADNLYDAAMRMFAAQFAAVLGTSTAQGAESPKSGTRVSQEGIEEALARIIELLEKHPSGLRSEEIRSKLSMEKKLFQYAANLGKTSDQLVQEGERRSTTYSLPTKTSPAQAEGRVVKRRKRT
jgi:hypothetical protein